MEGERTRKGERHDGGLRTSEIVTRWHKVVLVIVVLYCHKSSVSSIKVKVCNDPSHQVNLGPLHT